MVRVVVDTNVLASALINPGKPRALIIKLLEEHKVILSQSMLEELFDVLTREKFCLKDMQVESFVQVF